MQPRGIKQCIPHLHRALLTADEPLYVKCFLSLKTPVLQSYSTTPKIQGKKKKTQGLLTGPLDTCYGFWELGDHLYSQYKKCSPSIP